MKKQRFKNNGFTIIELMIVVMIIVALAAIAITNVLRARVSANDSAAQAALRSISTALENYAASNAAYPTAFSVLTVGTPPFIDTNYFSGIHNGFTFSGSSNADSYSVTATPTDSNAGTSSFNITTGGVFSGN